MTVIRIGLAVAILLVVSIAVYAVALVSMGFAPDFVIQRASPLLWPLIVPSISAVLGGLAAGAAAKPVIPINKEKTVFIWFGGTIAALLALSVISMIVTRSLEGWEGLVQGVISVWTIHYSLTRKPNDP